MWGFSFRFCFSICPCIFLFSMKAVVSTKKKRRTERKKASHILLEQNLFYRWYYLFFFFFKRKHNLSFVNFFVDCTIVSLSSKSNPTSPFWTGTRWNRRWCCLTGMLKLVLHLFEVLSTALHIIKVIGSYVYLIQLSTAPKGKIASKNTEGVSRYVVLFPMNMHLLT